MIFLWGIRVEQTDVRSVGNSVDVFTLISIEMLPKPFSPYQQAKALPALCLILSLSFYPLLPPYKPHV
jgi:hypothetical protein